MKALRLARFGLGLVCVLVPFGAVVACTEVEEKPAEDTPDTGVTPTPTATTPAPSPDAATPAKDAGLHPDAAKPADGGPKADAKADAQAEAGPTPGSLTPIRQLSYADRFTDVSPSGRNYAISGNGQRMVYSTLGDYTAANPNKVFVADVDGTSAPVQVDAYVPLCFCDLRVAISDDGKTVVSSDSEQIRVRDAMTGSSKGQLTMVSNEVSDVGVNGAGTEVYFINRRDNGFGPPTNAPVQRGLWKVAVTTGADITKLTQILSPNDVAPLLNEPDANKVFPFNACGRSLAYSNDGSKLWVALQHNANQLVVATDGAGSAASRKIVVPPVQGAGFVFGIGATRDGTKVAASISNTTAPYFGEVLIVGGDGAGSTKLADAPSGCNTQMSVTDDAATVAMGNSSYVFPTNGGERWPVLLQTGSFSAPQYYLGEPDGAENKEMWMTPDGKRFMFLSSPNGGARRIAIAELGTSTLPVPTFTNLTVSAPFVTRATPTKNGSEVFLTVKASQPSFFFGMQDLLDGQLEGQLEGQKALRDDGTYNDKTKDDLVYSSDTVYAQQNAVLGARVLRVKAEAQDAVTKRRTGFAVDYAGFEVKSQ